MSRIDLIIMQSLMKTVASNKYNEIIQRRKNMIAFLRVDDRLIHGQCQTKIIPMNSINRVIGVDDETANNPMLKKIFEMAAPQGVKVTVHTFEDSLDRIRKCIVNDKRTLVIARRPSTFVKIYEAIPELYKTLNVANLPKDTEDGYWLRRDIWINSHEKEALDKLDEMGVDIYFQQFPGDGFAEIRWKDVKNK